MGITSDNVRNDASTSWGIVAHGTPYDFLPYGKDKYMISYRELDEDHNKVIVITEDEFNLLQDGKPLNDLVPWEFMGPGKYEMIITNLPYHTTVYRCSKLLEFGKYVNLTGKSFDIQWCKYGGNFIWLTDTGDLIYPTHRDLGFGMGLGNRPTRLDLEWKIFCGKYNYEEVYRRG